jgi:hypothetical protein
MTLVEKLLENSESDRDLLQKNVAAGDVPSIPRDAEFVLYAKDKERAELVCSFIHDNSYGRAIYQHVAENQAGAQHRIIVAVFMPTTEHALCAVSGLMVCLAKLYDLDYDGWGCSLQEEPIQPPQTTPGSCAPLRV